MSSTRCHRFPILVVSFGLLLAVPTPAQQGKKYGTLFLKEFQPKNAEETDVVNVLMQYEAAFNSHDLERLVSLFGKDAIYYPCGYMKCRIANKDCQDRTRANFSIYGFETYYDPQILLNGDKAIVKLLLETGALLVDYTFSLSKESGEWRVAETSYINVRYKG